MKLTYFYKKIPVSPNKLIIFVRKIKKLSLNNIYNYLIFSNIKIHVIFKKMLNNIIYSLKFKEIKNLYKLSFSNIYIGRGKIYKKIYFRCKGRTSLKSKYFSNISFIIYI